MVVFYGGDQCIRTVRGRRLYIGLARCMVAGTAVFDAGDLSAFAGQNLGKMVKPRVSTFFSSVWISAKTHIRIECICRELPDGVNCTRAFSLTKMLFAFVLDFAIIDQRFLPKPALSLVRSRI